MPAKEQAALRVGHLGLAIADDDVAHDLGVHLEGPDLGGEVRPDELQKRRELVGLALVRGRGQQQERGGAVAQRAHQPVALRLLAGGLATEPMRLVEHDHVPRPRPQEAGRVLLALGEVEGDDDVLAPAHLVGVLGREVAAVDFERSPELDAHRGLPLLGQRRGADDEHAPAAVALRQGVEDQADLDRLAQAHVVGDQPAGLVRGHDPAGDVELVGQGVDVETAESPGVGVPDAQRLAEEPQPDPLGVVVVLSDLSLRDALLYGRGLRQDPPVEPPGLAALGELDQHLVEAGQPPGLKDLAHAQRTPATLGRCVADLVSSSVGVRELSGRQPPRLVRPEGHQGVDARRGPTRLAHEAEVVVRRSDAAPYRRREVRVHRHQAGHLAGIL